MIYFLTFFLFVITSDVTADSATEVRELWLGEFVQMSGVTWTGQMELYLRYDASLRPPQPFDGIITWPGLGGARTKVSGKRDGKTISFIETKCVENCGQVVAGGKYNGKFNDLYDTVTGTATHSMHNLRARFKLKRVMTPEE